MMLMLSLMALIISCRVGNTHSRKPPSLSAPNFIFILADDLEFNALNMDINANDDGSETESGDLYVATSTLRNLAQNGVYMNNFYSQESCAPARSSLFTGRYPIHVGTQKQTFSEKKDVGVNLDETYLSEVLQDNGYTVYGLGKWHAGFYSPAYLPVSRGFDYYLGYMTADETYWSKAITTFGKTYHDLLYMNSDCYHGYDGSDIYDYSSYFYREKAVDIITNHDYDASPMFLYIAFQAVHTPYYDDLQDFDIAGIPSSYVGEDNYEVITTGIEGTFRKELALNLYLMDEAVGQIVDALATTGQSDNTYIIFAADNGGCGECGGRNGPLVGQKGGLFDGGIKVDSFIYSSGLIADEFVGTTYGNLMHISDWFPTILSLADIEYTAPSGYELDSYDHSDSIFGDSDAPRSLLLHNIYYNFTDGDDYNDFSSNIQFAIRNKKYKLVHAYDNGYKVYDYDDELSDDDIAQSASEVSCGFDLKGTYTKYLFDIENDPYETTNLYDDDEYSDIISYLTSKAKAYGRESAYCDTYGDEALEDDDNGSNAEVKKAWNNAGYYLVPWIDTDNSEYASYCFFTGVPGISPSESTSKTMSQARDEKSASYSDYSTATAMTLIAVMLFLLIATLYMYKRDENAYQTIPSGDENVRFSNYAALGIR